MAHRTARLTGDGARTARVVHAVPDAVAAGRLELRQLRYFVTLAEELHFGRAAGREHIAPSALTAQLQRLERALGVLLVDRSPRRIALTAAGRAVPDRGPAHPGARGPGGDGRPGRRAEPADACGSACSTRGTTRSRPVLRAVQDSPPGAGDPPGQRGCAGAVPVARRRPAGRRGRPGVRRVHADRVGAVPAGPAGRAGARRPPVRGADRGAGGRAERRDAAARRPGAGRPSSTSSWPRCAASAGFFPALFHGSVQNLRAAVDLVSRAAACCACRPPRRRGRPTSRGGRSSRPYPAIPGRSCGARRDPSSYAVSLVATARRLCVENGWRSTRRPRSLAEPDHVPGQRPAAPPAGGRRPPSGRPAAAASPGPAARRC